MYNPTFMHIRRSNTVGETREFPYMAGVVNYVVWGLYVLPSVQGMVNFSLFAS
jgi:hypothetical protein